MDSKTTKPYLIGIAGGSGSGKTSVANIIFKYVGRNNCLLFSMDSYYRELTLDEMKNVEEFNFDSPDALDLDLLSEHLTSLMQWNSIEMPIYNFALNKREKETQAIIPNKIIIFEGILAFHDKRIRSMMNMKIFVDLDRDIRLSRRIYRDIIERGRDLKTIIYRYHKFVKPAYEMHIKSTRKWADVILPKGTENSQAIDLLSHHFRWEISKGAPILYNTSTLLNNHSNRNDDLDEMTNEDVFSQDSLILSNKNNNSLDQLILPLEKDQSALMKILKNFLKQNKMAYYKIYMEMMIRILKSMTKQEPSDVVLYTFIDTDDNIQAKLNEVVLKKGNVIVFAPILLSSDERLKKIMKQLNEMESSVTMIQLISIYSCEEILKEINEICGSCKYCCLYFGKVLKIHLDYIMKGGFIGDLEGEYQAVDFLFTKKNFENMFKMTK